MDSCCIFNDFVVCAGREIQSGKCRSCGWNPDVAKARGAQSKMERAPMTGGQELKKEEKMED